MWPKRTLKDWRTSKFYTYWPSVERRRVCVSVLLSLTSGCKCTLWSRAACTACRWALSNHTCVPVTLCRGWETSDEAQKRKISQSRFHTQLCIREYTQRHTQANTHALLNKHTTHTGDQNSPKTRSYHPIIIFSSASSFFYLYTVSHSP